MEDTSRRSAPNRMCLTNVCHPLLGKRSENCPLLRWGNPAWGLISVALDAMHACRCLTNSQEMTNCNEICQKSPPCCCCVAPPCLRPNLGRASMPSIARWAVVSLFPMTSWDWTNNCGQDVWEYSQMGSKNNWKELLGRTSSVGPEITFSIHENWPVPSLVNFIVLVAL